MRRCLPRIELFHKVPRYVVIVLLIIFLVATVIISCLAIHLCARRIQKTCRALGRNVTSSHLTPLVNDGNIDRKINTSGRTQCRWLDQRLPLIAISALEGNEYMLRKLSHKDADLTFVDSKTGQNLLHLTCSSGVASVVRWCLQHPQIHLDCLTSPRPGDLQMTPLMHVLRHLTAGNKYAICRDLIYAGCDVSKTDSGYWTVFHYVTIHGNSDIISLVIKATPIHPSLTYRNDTDRPPCGIPGHERSPMVSLLQNNKDMVNSHLMLEAGYNLQRDRRLTDHFLSKLDVESDLHRWLVREMCTPTRLMCQCRTVIRKAIGGIKLHEKIKSLNLPPRLVSYVQLNTTEKRSSVL